MEDKNKPSLETLWAKYHRTLELLKDALEKLEQKPKEVERIVEVERVVEVPVTEYLEVPVDKVIDISDQERSKFQKRIQELENKVLGLEKINKQLSREHWGKPSKKIIDDNTYEIKTEARFNRLVSEVKSGSLDINNLNPQEQEIVKRLLKNE